MKFWGTSFKVLNKDNHYNFMLCTSKTNTK